MTYRGRLIQRFSLVVERLDAQATAAVVGGGYDDRFGEAVPVEDATQFGASSVRYHTEDVIPCQVDRAVWGRETMSGGGEEQETEAIFSLHFSDLETLGLVLPSGEPRIGIGDRVIRLQRPSGSLVVSWESDPLYVTQAEQAGMGIDSSSGGMRNLLFLHCKHSRKGIRSRS